MGRVGLSLLPEFIIANLLTPGSMIRSNERSGFTASFESPNLPSESEGPILDFTIDKRIVGFITTHYVYWFAAMFAARLLKLNSNNEIYINSIIWSSIAFPYEPILH